MGPLLMARWLMVLQSHAPRLVSSVSRLGSFLLFHPQFSIFICPCAHNTTTKMVFTALQFPLSISLFHTQKMAVALTSLPTHTQLPLCLLALSILTFADNQISSTFLYTRVHFRTRTYTHTHSHLPGFQSPNPLKPESKDSCQLKQ